MMARRRGAPTGERTRRVGLSATSPLLRRTAGRTAVGSVAAVAAAGLAFSVHVAVLASIAALMVTSAATVAALLYEEMTRGSNRHNPAREVRVQQRVDRVAGRVFGVLGGGFVGTAAAALATLAF